MTRAMLILLSSPFTWPLCFQRIAMRAPAEPGGTQVALERAGRRIRMLETIAIILIVLWLLGVVSGYTMGNFIYVLLIVAIVLFLVRLIGGRRVV
jgi:hypothetical protein